MVENIVDLRFQTLLQNSPLNVFKEFLHACVDNICGRKSATYENFKSITNWQEEDYNILITGMKELCIQVFINKFNNDQIKEILGDVDSSHLEMVLECFSVRQNDIKNILLQEQCGISGPVLQDFDWKIKWVMGSSKLALLREPLLNLDLYLTEDGSLRRKGTQRVVNLELDKDELSKLISVLEKAQETLSNWHT